LFVHLGSCPDGSLLSDRVCDATTDAEPVFVLLKVEAPLVDRLTLTLANAEGAKDSDRVPVKEAAEDGAAEDGAAEFDLVIVFDLVNVFVLEDENVGRIMVGLELEDETEHAGVLEGWLEGESELEIEFEFVFETLGSEQ